VRRLVGNERPDQVPEALWNALQNEARELGYGK
jgi:hypothetical protein